MAKLETEEGRREFNPPSGLRSVSGSSRNALRKADVDLTQLEAHFGAHAHTHKTHTHTRNTVVIKRLGDMPDGPRRARLNADPRAELINNRDIYIYMRSLPSLSLSSRQRVGNEREAGLRIRISSFPDLIEKRGNWVAPSASGGENPLYPS